MGHHGARQPLRPRARQRRLPHPRRRDRHRRRHRELQPVRAQFLAALGRIGRRRAAQRLRRSDARPRRRGRRLLVPRAEQLHPPQRRSQCRRVRLRSRRRIAGRHRRSRVQGRRHQRAARNRRPRYDRCRRPRVQRQRSVRRDASRRRVGLERDHQTPARLAHVAPRPGRDAARQSRHRAADDPRGPVHPRQPDGEFGGYLAG